VVPKPSAPPEDRLPVLVGAGQLNQRVDRGAEALEPVDLMAEALRLAEADAGVAPGRLLAGADSVRVVSLLSWRYRDPAALVAERVGAAPRQTMYTPAGGNLPQSLVNRTALDIQDGRLDVALVAGAEAWRTRMALRARGERPDWTVQDDDVQPTDWHGSDAPMAHPAETARGIFMPVQHYPMFESAVRSAAGRSIEDHQGHLGRLWAGFSEVAAANPNAWIDRAYTAEEIRTPGPDNRLIGFPYPKLMNSNNNVEQSAALVLCSVERARALGVPPDRWVFPLAGADARDTPFVSHRPALAASAAMRLAGAAALDLAGVGIDDVAHVDLYSCFPSAVQVAAAELGLGLDRPLTVTGGMSFAGGPWNNYVTHAIATMAGRLREDAGAVGLCTANGGYLTKHAFGLYSTRPPTSGRFGHAEPQAAVDAAGARELCEEWDGPVVVEAVTVMYDRDGSPETGLVATLLPDGRRAWGTTTEPAAMKTMVTEECVGRAGRLDADGRFRFG
jgi:acetyl-CoA C-acetyltransferase